MAQPDPAQPDQSQPDPPQPDQSQPDPPYDVEIRVAHRLGSTVAAALGDATTHPEGPRMHLRIVSPGPLALADLAERLDALGLVVDGIRVTPGR